MRKILRHECRSAWIRKNLSRPGPYVVPMATGTRLLASLVEHPASAGETYLQHLRRALRVAATLAMAAGAALVHALVPALCTTRASDTIFALHDDLRRVRDRQDAA